ncbi:hypothetical protein JCM6882_003615 [Rhodosporidiobolus microsporus]
MNSSLRVLAKQATPRTSRFANKPALPLDYFINRANALSLYRQFVRATRGLGDLTARWETAQFVRGDFERYKDVVDSEKAKTLLALGNRQLKQLNSTGSLIGGQGDKWRGRKGLKAQAQASPSGGRSASTSGGGGGGGGIFQSFLRSSGRTSAKAARALDAEEERLSRERNIETAKALERTLRSTRGTGYGSGGGSGGTLDIRTTTLDSKGTVTTMSATALSKQELCAKFGIPPRDLRKLDSGVPTVVPTILSRKSCIILTILHLRVAITAREVTIFDAAGSEDSWLKGVFIWSLEHALKTTSKAAHGLPYEFRALEACLVNVLTALETDLVNIRSHVVELLAHMEEHIDRDNLRLMLQYSRKLSIFQKRAALVQECLDELLANDADLAALYLTAKLQGKPRTAEDHEEIELLLESFSKQCEEIVSEVETLSANVRHTEDIIELILDANRNSLLGLDLRVSIMTLGLTAGAGIAALFGMLTTRLEETPWAFPAITLFASAVAALVTASMLRRLARLRKVNLGWREELRQAGDRWARGKKLSSRSRRRD